MKNFLDRASKAYYEGEPIISDAEFDILSSHFGYKTVGHTITGGVPHFYRMYSLQNCFNLEAAPLSLKDCVETPKLDGAAVSLLYVGGELSLALTRGDGKVGRDITEKMATLVPITIEELGVRQVNGEVVATKDIPNSRNFAAGSLNLKSLEEFASGDLTFVAYHVEEPMYRTYLLDMEFLDDMGFVTVTGAPKVYLELFPQDGLVYRVDSNEKFKELGYTSHHPRGAFALKEQQEGVITTLNDVVWQVGRSGQVAPVAILEPVKIDDALVSRATLHNIEYIEGLNLEIGCKVEVIRSGEIIPRIVRRID